MLLFMSFPNFFVNGFSVIPGIIAWFALVPLLVLIDFCSSRQAFLFGFLEGLIYSAGTLYWITVINDMGIMAYPAWVVLSCYLAFFVAFFALLMKITFPAPGFSAGKILSVPLFWVAIEYFRGHFLSGFPWALLGYSQYLDLPVIQISSITGVYGVSFLLALTSAFIAYGLIPLLRRKAGFTTPGFGIALALTVFLVGGSFLYGFHMLKSYSNAKNCITEKVSILQGNIAQSDKWDVRYLDRTFETYADLTHQVGSCKPRLIVWPETAAPVFLPYETRYLKKVINIVADSKTFAIVGSVDAVLDEQFMVKEYFNTAFLLTPEGKITGKYSKIHLVPFGEFVPFKKIFKILEKFTLGFRDFRPGKEYRVFSLPSTTGSCRIDFSVLICYEIIFPELVRQFGKNGADFFVTITNDAWYDRTAMPYQHVMVLPFRAVENRRAIVRSANTGISCFVDRTGRFERKTGIFTREILCGDVRVNDGKTFYSTFGDVFAWFCIFFCLAILIVCLTKRRVKAYNNCGE